MGKRYPRVNVDILVTKGNKILLGLLAEKWNYSGRQVYGVPGREVVFGEKIGETVKRNIKEEFGCGIKKYEIICVNANYALGNHYIGIGVATQIDGETKLLMPKDWQKWEWFAKDEIPANLFPPTKNLIDCYLGRRFLVSE